MSEDAEKTLFLVAKFNFFLPRQMYPMTIIFITVVKIKRYRFLYSVFNYREFFAYLLTRSYCDEAIVMLDLRYFLAVKGVKLENNLSINFILLSSGGITTVVTHILALFLYIKNSSRSIIYSSRTSRSSISITLILKPTWKREL